MVRAASALLAVLSLGLCVLVLAVWARNHWVQESFGWRRFAPAGDELLSEHAVTVDSAAGGLRLAVLWGVRVDYRHGLIEERYGPAGLYHVPLPKAGAAYPAPRDPSRHWTALGLGVESGEDPEGWPGRLKVQWIGIILPHAVAAALLAAWPALWAARATRKHRLWKRHRDRLCYACGYDLRASKDRCPECGGDIATTSQAAAASGRLAMGCVIAAPLLMLGGLALGGFFEPPGPPAAPTNLTIKRHSQKLIVLRWTDHADVEDSYVVEQVWPVQQRI